MPIRLGGSTPYRSRAPRANGLALIPGKHLSARVLAASTAAILVTGVGLAAPAQAAAAAYTVTTAPLAAATGWLAGQLVGPSHLPTPAGDHLDQSFGGQSSPNFGATADLVLGLAAGKAAHSKLTSALAYLESHVADYTDYDNATGYGPFDGSLGKLAVTTIAAGANPRDFGGVNLVGRLKDDECPPDATTCTGAAANIYSSISESFVILAEARTGGDYAPSAAAIKYLLSLQCASGGFTADVTACGSGAADIDATSYALMALHAVGGHDSERAAAVAWLTAQQSPTGYWVSQDTPNPNSTGLAAAALDGEAADVTSARLWLRSQQVPAGRPGAGAIKYAGAVTATTTTATSPSVLATAQTLCGLADNGNLATLTAVGAVDDLPVFAPATDLSTQTVKPGAKQTATGRGFVAGEKVRAVVRSSPVTVGTATASPLGVVTLAYRLPSSLEAGIHTLTLTGLTSGLETVDRFAVPDTRGSLSPPPGSATPTAPTSIDPQSAPIAATGQDGRWLTELALIGIAAVLGGAALMATARRRRSR